MMKTWLVGRVLVLSAFALFVLQLEPSIGTAQIAQTCNSQTVVWSCAFYQAGDIIRGVALSPDEQIVATAATSNRSTIVNASDGTVIAHMPESEAYGVTFSPDGSLIALGQEGYVTIRSSRTGQILMTLPAAFDGGFVDSLEFSPDGSLLAAGSPGYVYMWRVSDGALLSEILVSPRSIGQIPNYWGVMVDLSPDGRTLAVASFEGGWLFEVTSDGLGNGTLLHERLFLDTAFSYDGTKVAFGYEDAAWVYDFSAGAGSLQVFTFEPGVNNFVSAVDFTRDGRGLITGHHRGIKITDLETGQLIFENKSVQSAGGRVERFMAITQDETAVYVPTESGTAHSGLVYLYALR